MTAFTPDEITALRGAVEAATSGPWELDGPEPCYTVVSTMLRNGGAWVAECEESPEDAALIVAAVNALPGLLDEVERLRSAHAEKWLKEPRPHHFIQPDGTCHSGDLFEHGTISKAVYIEDDIFALSADLDRLRGDVALLTRERDEWEANEQEQNTRADEAEAEVQRLRDGIEGLAESTPHKTTDHLGNVTGYLIAASDLRALLANGDPE